MSKQFSIVLTDVDLQTLEKLLRDSGDVELLAHVPTEDDRSLRPLGSLAIPVSHAGKVPLWCYLAPLGLPKTILLKRLSPVKIEVNVDRSHLIDVRRPFYNGHEIRSGRFYYQNWFVENQAWVPKNPEFCRWADHVMARVKRTLKFDKASYAYLGAHATERIASGTLTPL